MKHLILYQLNYDVEYEGSYCEGVFSTYDKAEKYQSELLEKRRQTMIKDKMKSKQIEEDIKNEKLSYSIDKIMVDNPTWDGEE
jgi:hypothetical protein